MPDDRIPMTREGYDKLRSDLDRMQGPQMIEVTKRVATARAMGDLSENAEYHAAREDQGMLEARIRDLSDRLASEKRTQFPGHLTIRGRNRPTGFGIPSEEPDTPPFTGEVGFDRP